MSKNRPAADELTFTTLDNEGTASSWWNHLKAAQKNVTPTLSADGRTYSYGLSDACGLVIGISGNKAAAEYAVPTLRVLVPDKWKKMDFEIEWGYEPGRAAKNYGGCMEIYDGRMAGLTPLDQDTGTAVIDASFLDICRQERPAPRREGESVVHGHVEVAADHAVHQSR